MNTFSTPAPPTSLVLLPPDPSQAVSSALLAAALRHAKHLQLSQQDPRARNHRRGITAALPLAGLVGGRPRAQLFAAAQAAVAAAYRAACAAAAREGVEVAADVSPDDDGQDDAQDGADDRGAVAVDVGVVLVPFDASGEPPERGWFGPVVALAALARRRGGWEAVWAAADGAGGDALRRRFEALAPAGGVVAVRGVPVPAASAPDVVAPEQRGGGDAGASSSARCRSVIVGGTFDHLHVGHKLLLTMTAFALDLPADDDSPEQRREERMLTVGMTAADLLAKKKYAEALQPWHTRTRRAHAFLRSVLRPDLDGGEEEEVEEVHAPGPNGHAVRVRLSPPGEGGPSLVLNYVEIWDPFGPTITDPRIDTLVVSAETRGGGAAVNPKRGEVGMAAVVVCEVDVLDARVEGSEGVKEGGAFEDKFSSTEIRRAVVERRRMAGRSKV
jgi:phosphopantetheine adenylyltransferase